MRGQRRVQVSGILLELKKKALMELYELLSHFLCVLRACNDALKHYITYLASPKGEGFQPSLKETIN